MTNRIWLGLAVSILFIALLLWRVDLGEVVESLRKANYLYVIPGIVIYFVIALAFRTVRWRLLLLGLRPIPVRRLLPVVVVGYMANNLLPMRLGELVRSHYVGQREGVSKTAALTTVGVERVVDGVVLLLLLGVMAVFLPLPDMVEGLARDTGIPLLLLVAGGTVPFVGVLALLILTARNPAWLLRLIGQLTKLMPDKAGKQVVELAEKAVTGLSLLRNPRQMGMVFLLSLPVWLGEAAMYYVIGFSFGLEEALGGVWMMIPAMIAVTATSNLATAIPASQGSIGPFELFATGTLVVLGVSGETAAAYALTLHVALLAPVTLAGLVHLWGGKDSLRQLVQMSSKPGDASSSRWQNEGPPEVREVS